MVLKILKEMLQHQSERFMPYVELTILRLLEFEKDTDKEVSTDLCSYLFIIDTLYCLYARVKSFAVTVKNDQCRKSRVTAGRHDIDHTQQIYACVYVHLPVVTVESEITFKCHSLSHGCLAVNLVTAAVFRFSSMQYIRLFDRLLR